MRLTKNFYRKEARDRDCQVRLPLHCNFDSDTTVLAHKNGGGMGMKALDIHGAWCCSSCHDVIDNRVKTELEREDVILSFYEAIFRTQEILIREDKL